MTILSNFVIQCQLFFFPISFSNPIKSDSNSSRWYNKSSVAIIYTKHASEMLAHRGIKQELADQCANNPDITLPTKEGYKIFLKVFGKNYLKLVVSEEMEDKIIITVHWLAKKRVKS